MSLLIGISVGFALGLGATSPIRGPQVAVELAADGSLAVWVGDGDEVLDSEVRLKQRDSQEPTTLSPMLREGDAVILSAPAESFRVEVRLVVAHQFGDREVLLDVVRRAYFLCAAGSCAEASYSDYVVGIGRATREIDFEGKAVLVLPLEQDGDARRPGGPQ